MANIWYIQVNRHCNNGCHFCSNPSNGNNISYERWIELIDDFIERKYRGVIFTWGEPTLSPDLPRWITYTVENGIENRIISNGMMCSSPDFMKRLADSGLQLVHFSVFSCHEKIHDFLSDTPGSWKKLMMSISNALRFWVRVQINTVINHYNQNHLDKTVQFLVKHFPQIQHFVWNNLDPMMMRKTKVALSTLPSFQEFEAPLRKSMEFLESKGKTFRAERVPLCYMRWFERASTETRKIVKDEERIVYFLDQRNMIEQKSQWFYHDKWVECGTCDLNPICAGIWFSKPTTMCWVEHPGYYKEQKFKTQRVSETQRCKIISDIKS